MADSTDGRETGVNFSPHNRTYEELMREAEKTKTVTVFRPDRKYEYITEWVFRNK